MTQEAFSGDVVSSISEWYNVIFEDGELTYEFIDGKYHSFNGKVVIPVRYVKKNMLSQDYGDVDIINSGVHIATLCLLTNISDESKKIDSFSEDRLFSCFVDSDGNVDRNDYTFRNNYVVTTVDNYRNYFDVMSTSEIWGGFSHDELDDSITIKTQSIDVCEGVKYPTEQHKNAMILAVDASNAFDRYLKCYHQIELLFDVIAICEMKALNSSSLNDYVKVISRFSSRQGEIGSLAMLFDTFIGDGSLQAIIDSLSPIIKFEPLAKKIFQDVEKKHNPIPDDVEWNALLHMIRFGVFNDANTLSYTMPDSSIVKLRQPKVSFKSFLLKVISYWIYRVRCSIAHNKIGEYVFDYKDEPFISDFMENVILEIIKVIFSNGDLHQTLKHLPSS